jgi:hypothetical protein
MIVQEEISGNGHFDFYAGHYGRFDGKLAAEVRREVYGDDLGQTGWRTAAEQAEIAHDLRLGPDSRVLDIACGAGGRRSRWSSALDVRLPASTSSPPELNTPTPRLARAGSPTVPLSPSWTAAAGFPSSRARSVPSSASMR